MEIRMTYLPSVAVSRLCIVLVCLLVLPSRLFADEPAELDTLEEVEETVDVAPAKFYSTPAERREAGMGRELTGWLTVSGLIEVETVHVWDSFRGGESEDEQTDENLQLGFGITFTETLGAEMVFEYEAETGLSKLDEGLVSYESEVWGASAGRYYVPFGEYFSSFVVGPMLEFGETRVNAVGIDYSWEDRTEVFAYLFESEVDKTGDNTDKPDWGLGLELSSADDAVKLGVNYISDIAESDEGLLEDFDNRYRSRVGGWNAYAIYGMEQSIITAEMIRAADKIDELDPEEDQPFAWNVELAWYPRSSYQFAVRLEHSNELSDQPEWQYGVSFSWRIHKNIGIVADYLYGDYKDGFVTDDNDNELRHRNLVAGQLVIEF
jgi:hypothetical protein